MPAVMRSQTDRKAAGEVSDRAIAREAHHRPRRSGDSPVRGVSCEARDGRLVLRGARTSQYLKQVARAAVAEVGGVARLVNRIAVADAWSASL